MGITRAPAEICHRPIELDAAEIAVLDREIVANERTIGIVNERLRWREASLFIDKAFIDTAILNGRARGFERLLGHHEWNGYLEAKYYCDNYGYQQATPEFFLEIHRNFLKHQAPEVAGTYATGSYRGGSVGTDGVFSPVHLSSSEIAEIHKNEMLDFWPEGDDPNTGFIMYPQMTPKERHAQAQDICNWYNKARSASHDPFELAAQLQRKLISGHLYAFGICGRVARMAMNWSLINDFVPPSALEDYSGDIFLPEDQWVAAVKKGSERYDMFSLLTYMAAEGISALDYFGARPYYNAYRRNQEGLTPPPELEPGRVHRMYACREFLGRIGTSPGFTNKPVDYFYTPDGQVTSI